MELDITRFVNAHGDNMHTFADSIGRSGLDNIGQITWRNACKAMSDSADWFTADLDTLRAYFREFGAWSREELSDMDGQELNALLAQCIAGDYIERENAEDAGELAEYEENQGGRLCVSEDGESWYYYVGL